jgi:hypothetical protein
MRFGDAKRRDWRMVAWTAAFAMRALPLVLAAATWLLPAALVLLSATPAGAAPYWVAWEGNDFPENEGWERGHFGDNGPTAERSLTDGIMTLDGRASIDIVDGYVRQRQINPGPGEVFLVQWRLRVDDVLAHPLAPYDPAVIVYSDDGWEVILEAGEAVGHSLLEQFSFPMEPGVFHHWELRSSDMRSYDLFIDGALVYAGQFVPAVRRSQVEWGDLTAGAASSSRWDYFRFGVVPEPATWMLVGLGALGPFRPRRYV